MMKNVKFMMLLFLAFACFTACNDDDGNPQEICVEDDQVITAPLPESGSDCFFPIETIWSSNTARDIELSIETTGITGVDIEIEYENNTFQDLSISPAPALPQFRSITDAEFNDVIAIRVRCDREPSNGCGDCEYNYKVCIL